jgi:hypothetical protein
LQGPSGTLVWQLLGAKRFPEPDSSQKMSGSFRSIVLPMTALSVGGVPSILPLACKVNVSVVFTVVSPEGREGRCFAFNSLLTALKETRNSREASPIRRTQYLAEHTTLCYHVDMRRIASVWRGGGREGR